MRLKGLLIALSGVLLATATVNSASAQTFLPAASTITTAQYNAALAERQRLASFGSIDAWNCQVVNDLSSRESRLAYVWSVGYAVGSANPKIRGDDWTSVRTPSQERFSFDETMIDAIRGYCLLYPDNNLGQIELTARQEVAAGRLFKILSSYRWNDIITMQLHRSPEESQLMHRARSVMIDGFIAGQYKVARTADQIVRQGSAPWLCDAYEAMQADPKLALREAAVTFFDQRANVSYHQASCARVNFSLLAASGQVNNSALQRARQAGLPISLPQAIDPGPDF